MGNKQSTEEGTTQTGFHPLTASRPPGSISVVLSNTAHPPIPPHLSREAEERRRGEEGKDLSSTVKGEGGGGEYAGGAATEHRAMMQEQGGGTAAPSQAPASSSSAAAASEVAAKGATPNVSPDKRGGEVAEGAETPSNKLPATPDSVGKLDRSIAKFDGVLGKQIVALPDLRVLCWNGCPERHRATTWRLLLRYVCILLIHGKSFTHTNTHTHTLITQAHANTITNRSRHKKDNKVSSRTTHKTRRRMFVMAPCIGTRHPPSRTSQLVLRTIVLMSNRAVRYMPANIERREAMMVRLRGKF